MKQQLYPNIANQIYSPVDGISYMFQPIPAGQEQTMAAVISLRGVVSLYDASDKPVDALLPEVCHSHNSMETAQLIGNAILDRGQAVTIIDLSMAENLVSHSMDVLEWFDKLDGSGCVIMAEDDQAAETNDALIVKRLVGFYAQPVLSTDGKKLSVLKQPNTLMQARTDYHLVRSAPRTANDRYPVAAA